jgi:hypothetical protein
MKKIYVKTNYRNSNITVVHHHNNILSYRYDTKMISYSIRNFPHFRQRCEYTHNRAILYVWPGRVLFSNYQFFILHVARRPITRLRGVPSIINTWITIGYYFSGYRCRVGAVMYMEISARARACVCVFVFDATRRPNGVCIFIKKKKKAITTIRHKKKCTTRSVNGDFRLWNDTLCTGRTNPVLERRN